MCLLSISVGVSVVSDKHSEFVLCVCTCVYFVMCFLSPYVHILRKEGSGRGLIERERERPDATVIAI